MAAAFLLAGNSWPEAKTALETLLSDPDVLVRLTASEALFGDRARSTELANRYRYAEALAAERRAADLAAVISSSSLEQQYKATQELIGLGRPVCRALLRLAEGDGTLNRSAAFGLQEIRTRHKNACPQWTRDVEALLDTVIDEIDLGNRDPTEALGILSKASGVKLVLDNPRGLGQLPTFGGRFSNCTLRSILDTLCTANRLRYKMYARGLLITLHENLWDGQALVLLDVRDLAARDPAIDWSEFITGAYPGDSLVYCLPDSEWSKGDLRAYRNGFLILMPIANNSDPDGRLHVLPLVRHLEERRRELGLPPAGGVWPAWPREEQGSEAQ
jgi:hypothetical protein